ncbi:hypothetical protein KFZ58_01255 [Virgibacillus sp. NKC19-16]|uniref:hypothetical protein n=1 Tax=Virgibacillus salidurans TaxID=2831673 RepID=UPI001F19F8FC|nr:hypothetical protein [Virgibacillus sp. NKC19-16]UJL46619.1 hypothetical protein KFZ58_01255 [Virgibacillus sp. NKC19-16]
MRYFSEKEKTTISKEVEINPEIKKMIQEIREEYRQGFGMPTSDLLESFSSKDFEF